MAESSPADLDSVKQYLELEGLRSRSSISATDLLALPVFEKDHRDLPMFIESCEEFLETYADKKNPNNAINSYLLKLIKSRLAGDAKHLVSIRNCKTWPEIKELLEANFGDQRTENNLFNELINFRADNHHDYHAIGVEIRTLLSMTLAKCKLTVTDENELRIKENMYNKVALNSYLRNLYALNRNVADPVRFQNPSSLEEAMRLVVEEMNWQQSCFALHYPSNQKRHGNAQWFNNPPPIQPSYYNQGSFGVSSAAAAAGGGPTSTFQSNPSNVANRKFFQQAPQTGLGFSFGVGAPQTTQSPGTGLQSSNLATSNVPFGLSGPSVSANLGSSSGLFGSSGPSLGTSSVAPFGSPFGTPTAAAKDQSKREESN